jgi:hydroxyacylglutathione hydrolase
VNEGAHLPLGGHGVLVLATPGHTLGHVSYFIAAARAVFVGDTLFAMGCGRLFEGTAEAMWGSLSRLRGLPDATTIYCGHDYAAANARFALTIEPHNAALTARAKDVAAIAAAGGLTPPTTIGLERATNPLLRADEPAVRARLRMTSAKAHEVFAEIRRRKDEFG